MAPTKVANKRPTQLLDLFSKADHAWTAKASETQMSKRPTDDEALRLVIAFYCIMEPDRQAQVLALAERYADESRDADTLVETIAQAGQRKA